LANPSYLLDELVHHIKDSGPKVLVVGKPIIEVAKKAAIECGIAESNIYMMEDDAHEQYQSIWSLAGTEELEPRRLSPHEAKQRTAFMCYSSGTTGKAKGGTVQLIIVVTKPAPTTSQCSGDYSL
jgi:acyl-CoA synthetase (AMP-forming)/AMP-acid ligase II